MQAAETAQRHTVVLRAHKAGMISTSGKMMVDTHCWRREQKKAGMEQVCCRHYIAVLEVLCNKYVSCSKAHSYNAANMHGVAVVIHVGGHDQCAVMQKAQMHGLLFGHC